MRTAEGDELKGELARREVQQAAAHKEELTALKASYNDSIDRLKAVNVPMGILTSGDFARACIDRGAAFVAVGGDAGLLARAARDLAAAYRTD